MVKSGLLQQQNIRQFFSVSYKCFRIGKLVKYFAFTVQSVFDKIRMASYKGLFNCLKLHLPSMKTWQQIKPNILRFSVAMKHSMAANARTTNKGFIEVDNQKLNTTWLRENCKSTQCYNHLTNQRNVLFYDLSEAQTTVEGFSYDGDKLKVKWKDGHCSEYDLKWIKDHLYPGPYDIIGKQLWNAEQMKSFSLTGVEYNDVMKSEEALKDLLSSLLMYGIGLVHGVPDTLEATQETAERVSFIQHTMFGGMWSFTSDLARGDTAYTNITLGAHTDTTYLSIPAGIQLFHCLVHDGTGGETLLVDGFRAAEDLRSRDPEAFDLLTRHRIQHHYMEPGHYVQSLDPVIKVNPVSGSLEMIRYNHYDRTPIRTIPQEQLPEYYNSLAKLSQLITRENGEFWLKLNPGTVLFVDNWRVLHGRASFTGYRHMCGAYLPRDDWIGKARILGLVPA